MTWVCSKCKLLNRFWKNRCVGCGTPAGHGEEITSGVGWPE